MTSLGLAGACWNGGVGCCYPRGILLVCPLFTAQEGSVPEVLCRDGGKADLEWLKLSFFGVFLSLLNVTLCKQRLIEEERLLEHISKILEN